MGEHLVLSPEFSLNHYANCTDEVEIGQVRGLEDRGVFPAEGTFSGKTLRRVRTFRNFGWRVLEERAER